MKLTDPSTIQKLLQEQGASPKHSAGQNFLICDDPIEATVDVVSNGPQAITELGSGAGPLTQALLEKGMQVRAIERDEVLANILKSQTNPKDSSRLDLNVNDLRAVKWEWDEPYQLVGNIPYNLSGLILRQITQLTTPPSRVVLLVQKEVGDRVTAMPPDMSLIGVAVQLWGEAEKIMTVPPSCFWPQPKVTSELILITPHKHLDETATRESIIKIAKILFQGRRKQIGGMLSKQLHLDKTVVAEVLQKSDIQPIQRPQELTLEQWKKLHQEIKSYL